VEGTTVTNTDCLQRAPGLVKRNDPTWRSVEEAAAALEVNRGTIYRWHQDGELPYEVRDGRRWMTADAIEAKRVERAARKMDRATELRVFDMNAQAIAAEYLCSVRKARSLLSSGAIPNSQRVAGEWRARRVDVERYAEAAS
jgi:excisionase family DNA binding protein